MEEEVQGATTRTSTAQVRAHAAAADSAVPTLNWKRELERKWLRGTSAAGEQGLGLNNFFFTQLQQGDQAGSAHPTKGT